MRDPIGRWRARDGRAPAIGPEYAAPARGFLKCWLVVLQICQPYGLPGGAGRTRLRVEVSGARWRWRRAAAGPAAARGWRTRSVITWGGFNPCRVDDLPGGCGPSVAAGASTPGWMIQSLWDCPAGDTQWGDCLRVRIVFFIQTGWKSFSPALPRGHRGNAGLPAPTPPEP
jgi:hypothetical protein